MENRGIMQQVRELLSQGKPSREVIQLGYAPGTVYKVQRQVRDGRVPAVQSHSLEIAREGTPGESPLLQGHLAVFPDEEEGTVAFWHFDPPWPCPGCGVSVVHWGMCHLCNKLLPEACHCPLDSPARGEGFTLHDLLDGLKHVS